MEQLNRGNKQDNDVGYRELDIGSDIDELLAKGSYLDMRAAPRSKPIANFAGIVRNKSAPAGLREKIPQKINIPSEIYQQKIRLESFKPEYEIFKNYLLDSKSLSKLETKDISGMITVKEYTKKLLKEEQINKGAR